MRLIAVLALLAVSAGAGCGGAKDVIGRYGPQAASLTIVVRPDGPGGPARRNTIQCARFGPGAPGSPECSRPEGFDAGALAPTPPATACAAIFGGPAVATVRGAVLGKDVNARFTLVDSCEIERWQRNSVLPGDPPRRG